MRTEVGDRLMRRVWVSPWTMAALWLLFTWTFVQPGPLVVRAINFGAAVMCASSFFSRGRERWGSK